MLTYPRAVCSGVVISSQFVLTAGHCVSQGYPLRVVFFRTATRREDSRRVIKVYKHPNASLQNDVALIQFEGGLPSGEYYPFKTLKDISSLKSSEKAFIAGFGQSNPSRSSYGHLNFGTGTLSQSTERTLGFTSASNQGPCPGDSGSPVFVMRNGQMALVGIASIGYGPCDNNGGGGIYMSVPYFWPWIQSVVQKAKPPTRSISL
jgi:secreted trypsin-like serine protease